MSGGGPGSSTFTWQHALRLDSTKSPFSSPLASTHKVFADVSPISWRRYNIGGILTTIYGLQELPQSPSEIVCCWLLHGRGDTQDSKAPVAAALLHAWKSSPKSSTAGGKGLIFASFDQRNHGSRLIENDHNLSFKQGNPTHAIDMFNTYCGTSQDLSLLITQIQPYLPFKIGSHICAGLSLGGHATWVTLMREPRVKAGLIVVGCPDYIRLQTDRAIRQKVPSALSTDPPGKKFLGSDDFPQSLIAAVEEFDPAGILLSELDVYSADDIKHHPSENEIKRLKPIIERTLAGKKILCLSGGKDRLVPYVQSEPFMSWLKRGIDKETGWAKDQGIDLEDIIDPEAGHEFSKSMRKEAERWIVEVLSEEESASRNSKL